MSQLFLIAAVFSFVGIASTLPIPDECNGCPCSCILPIVILPGGGTIPLKPITPGGNSGSGTGTTSGILNNLLAGGILNGGLLNTGGVLGGLLGTGGGSAGSTGGILNNLAAGGILNGGLINDGPVYRSPGVAGQTTTGILNNALYDGILNGGLLNA